MIMPNDDTPQTAEHFAPLFAAMDADSLAFRLNSFANEQEADDAFWNAAILREAAKRIEAK